MTAEETASLNLAGDFARNAMRDAAAAQALAESFDRMATAGAKIKPGGNQLGNMSAVTAELERQATLEAKVATFDPARAKSIAALEKRYKSMNDEATGAAGDARAKAAMKEAEEQAKAAKSSEASSSAASKAAATAVLAAATTAVAAAAAIAAAGVHLAIEQSSKREAHEGILKGLGGDFDAAVKVSAKYGLTDDQGIGEFKKLLSARFSEGQVEAMIRVDVGIGAVLGEEKAKAYIEQMSKDNLKGGKASEETVKGFAEAGVDVEAVWAKLGEKMGTSAAIAKGKVKAGVVDMKDVLASVQDVADKQFGAAGDGVAKRIPALAMRVKSDLEHLFDKVDTGPVKELLSNIAGALEGPAGQALKSGITELFGAINHVFLDEFKGEEGKAKIEKLMKGAAGAVHEFAGAIKSAEPGIRMLERLAMAGAGGAPDALSTYLYPIKMIGEALNFIAEHPIIGDVLAAPFRVLGAALDLVLAPFRDLASMFRSFSDEAPAAGNAIGTNVDQGMADGMSGGLALAAAEAMAQGALAKVMGIFDQHSPSKAFHRIGVMNDQGMAGGMSGDASEAAGAQMASKALRAANDVSEGGAAGGGGAGAGGAPGAGGGSPTVVVQVTAPSGTTDPAAFGELAGEAAYRVIQGHLRRDARERAA